MSRLSLALALCIALIPQHLAAQTPADMKTFTSSREIQALIEKAKAAAQKNPQPTVTENILSLSPYRATLEYRTAVGPAYIHETRAELFYVIEGSGTLVTGGKLIDEKRTNAENVAGTGIEGGTAVAVAKGDFMIVPQNTPHWFKTIDGTLVLMSFHVPRQ
jgi:mannose-6-phosphate isomerase-like protein (cupin superfamily)